MQIEAGFAYWLTLLFEYSLSSFPLNLEIQSFSESNGKKIFWKNCDRFAMTIQMTYII